MTNTEVYMLFQELSDEYEKDAENSREKEERIDNEARSSAFEQAAEILLKKSHVDMKEVLSDNLSEQESLTS